jgi:hypothetical protein
MKLFSKSADPEPAPMESYEQARARRESELLEQIRTFDSQVETLRSLIDTFRREHLGIVNGKAVFVTSSVNSRDELASTWSTLVCEANELRRKRDAALAEYSELHSTPGEVASHG